MKRKATSIEIPSRREFFVKIAIASIATTLPALALSGCKDEIAYQGTGVAPFKVWEEMLQALKNQPRLFTTASESPHSFERP